MAATPKGGLPMSNKMRVMSDRPLNAETPTERLRSWITANDVFFDRNQGQLPEYLDTPGRLAVEHFRDGGKANSVLI